MYSDPSLWVRASNNQSLEMPWIRSLRLLCPLRICLKSHITILIKVSPSIVSMTALILCCVKQGGRGITPFPQHMTVLKAYPNLRTPCRIGLGLQPLPHPCSQCIKSFNKYLLDIFNMPASSRKSTLDIYSQYILHHVYISCL